MKKNMAMRFAAILLIATLVSACAISGTFAKFATQVTGTATAAIAKWNFTAGNSSTDASAASYTLNLNRNVDANLADGKIAPGSNGYFAVYAKNDSDTAAEYTATFTAADKPAGLQFYASADGTTKGDELTATSGTYTIASGKSLTTNGADTSYVIWEWPFGSAAESDQTTIADGTKSMTVTVTVTGTQVD